MQMPDSIASTGPRHLLGIKAAYSGSGELSTAQKAMLTSSLGTNSAHSTCKCPQLANMQEVLLSRVKVARTQDEQPADGSEPTDQLFASSAEDVRARRSTTAQVQNMANLTHIVQSYLGRLAYRYFNWRQDTWNDLQLFATINTVLLVLASLIKAKLVDPLDPDADNNLSSFQHFWQSVYEALVVVFGQDLPDTTASILQQLWALLVAAIGLAAFALVLALVEQVVLEVLKNNVQRGSQVYETGHVSDLKQHLLSAWHPLCSCASSKVFHFNIHSYLHFVCPQASFHAHCYCFVNCNLFL